METEIHWSCNTCGQKEGVENGICPKCGPTQTTPLSEQAKQEGGYYVALEERAKQAQTTEKKIEEATSTKK